LGHTLQSMVTFFPEDTGDMIDRCFAVAGLEAAHQAMNAILLAYGGLCKRRWRPVYTGFDPALHHPPLLAHPTAPQPPPNRIDHCSSSRTDICPITSKTLPSVRERKQETKLAASEAYDSDLSNGTKRLSDDASIPFPHARGEGGGCFENSITRKTCQNPGPPNFVAFHVLCVWRHSQCPSSNKKKRYLKFPRCVEKPNKKTSEDQPMHFLSVRREGYDVGGSDGYSKGKHKRKKCVQKI